MIQHCVFLRFKAAVQEAEKQAIYAAIADLKDVVPGMLEVKAGANVSPEGLTGGYNDGFIVTFEDEMVRDYYLKHPSMWKSVSGSSAPPMAALPASWCSISLIEPGWKRKEARFPEPLQHLNRLTALRRQVARSSWRRTKPWPGRGFPRH